MTAILVAEDEPGTCDLLTDVLETELYAMVRRERMGGLALRATETASFDLAIIDVNMQDGAPIPPDLYFQTYSAIG